MYLGQRSSRMSSIKEEEIMVDDQEGYEDDKKEVKNPEVLHYYKC